MYGGTVEQYDGAVEQYDGAVEQLNSVAQCGGTNGTVWNGMVEQYGTAWWNSRTVW